MGACIFFIQIPLLLHTITLQKNLPFPQKYSCNYPLARDAVYAPFAPLCGNASFLHKNVLFNHFYVHIGYHDLNNKIPVSH